MTPEQRTTALSLAIAAENGVADLVQHLDACCPEQPDLADTWQYLVEIMRVHRKVLARALSKL
jgi:hypothetical protein